MTDCGRLKEHYEGYALGVLKGEDRAEIDAHLARGCPVCTPGVARARWLVAQLAYAAPEADPPGSLRAGLLEAVREPSRGRIPRWAWAAVAALVLFSVFTGFRARKLQSDLAALEAQMQQEQKRAQELERERSHYQHVLAIVSAPGTRTTRLKPSEASLPEVQAYWNEQKGLVLTAERMPALGADRTFELWVVPKKGKPIPAGLFRPDAAGEVLIVSSPEAKPAEAAALAITNEPAGGQPQPTSKPLWVGPVS